MKKAYKKPQLEMVEYRFADHIAASGASGCHWGSEANWTHGYVNCKEKYNEGAGGWINLNG